jgi:hypothetical protein|tara:strand:+ start:225 stop:596 length:372 start_codon:yes stop_codon:yes gene_type:complete
MAGFLDMLGMVPGALANTMTGGNNAKSFNLMEEIERQGGGQGESSIASSIMQPQQPSTLGPLGGPLRTADNVGHGVPPASSGKADAFMRALLGKQALAQPGQRQQRFADFPQQGPAGQGFRRY